MTPVAGPTLVDVAREAGVSIATASRVLSGAQHVSESRSRAVRKAITDLGYRHNAVASALRSQRTETVGLILPRYTTGFLSALIESVSAALDDEGMSLVLRYSADGDDHDVATVESMLSRRVDGLIICPPSEDVSRDAIAAAARVPVVQVGRHIFGDGTDSVGLDDHRATDLLVGSLADGGARSLVTVGLSPGDPADARRIAAVRASCELRDVTFVEAITADAVLAGGVAAANTLLEGSTSSREGTGTAAGAGRGVPRGVDVEQHAVDAAICANDDVAHGLVTVLRLNGVAVPGTLQVASLLDVSLGEGDDREITTLRHPWPAMGREAVRLLIDALGSAAHADAGGARRVTLAPRLLKGRSSR